MSSHDMAPDKSEVQSPLHRLQEEIAKDTPYGFARSRSPTQYIDGNGSPPQSDTASLYSFDSVSTNGRLLDRLDLDSEYCNDSDSILRRRESTVLIQSTGRLLDRLGLDDSPEETAHNPFNQIPTRNAPIRANSSLGLERMRSAHKAPSRSHSQSNRLPIKSAPHNVVQPRKNFSFDSLNGEVSSGQGSVVSLSSLANPSGSSLNLGFSHGPIRNGSQNNVKKYPVTSPIEESFDISTLLGSNVSSSLLIDKPQLASHESSPEISPETLRLQLQQSLTRRTVSSSSNGSGSSFEISSCFFSPSSRFDPAIESSTNRALLLRHQGNPRESSYRLKLLADNPVNYPRAMYLYAQALWNGTGVKLNEAQGVRWLCRCVLASYILESSNIDGSVLGNYMPRFADMSIDKLIGLISKNISNEVSDVLTLTTKFLALSAVTISKVIQLNANDKNTVGGAYYLLGECLLTGQGLVTKKEETSRAFLAKAAALGYADAMIKLGELWCSKSKAFKKDLHLAAAWLRLGETFGKKDIGNSWIYKDKYMVQKKK